MARATTQPTNVQPSRTLTTITEPTFGTLRARAMMLGST